MGPHVGEIERGEWCTRRQKCACFAVGVVCEVSVREPHNYGDRCLGAMFCVYGKDTLYIVCVLGKERCGDT